MQCIGESFKTDNAFKILFIIHEENTKKITTEYHWIYKSSEKVKVKIRLLFFDECKSSTELFQYKDWNEQINIFLQGSKFFTIYQPLVFYLLIRNYYAETFEKQPLD